MNGVLASTFATPLHAGANLDDCDVLVCIGALPAETWERLHHRPVVIVVDRGATATAVTQRYAIRPGTEPALLHGLANILLAGGWIDRATASSRIADFDEFAERVTHFTTDRVCAETGIASDELWHCAQTIADGRRVAFFVNQDDEATRTAQAIDRLAQITGIIGAP